MTAIASVRRWRRWVHNLATYDVFPAFSEKVRKTVYTPLGVMSLMALASLLCGLFVHTQGYVMAGGVLAVIVLGLVWPWANLRGIRAAVRFDSPRVGEGEPIATRLTIVNRWPWHVWGLAIKGGFDDDSPRTSIACAPRLSEADFSWTFRPTRRGLYPRRDAAITTGFPFGLWDNRRALDVVKPLVVWPRIFPAGPVPPTVGENSVDGNVSRHQVGASGDVVGVRPYRRGDSPRRIHWPQSARHDRLIVCELQSTCRPVIQFVLDVSIAPEVREWAIRIVASLAKGWLDDGAQVGLVAASVSLPAASGTAQTIAILDSLATLSNHDERTLAHLLDDSSVAGFRDGLQVVVTTDVAIAQLARSSSARNGLRWVVLRAHGFDSAATPSTPLRIEPWIQIAAPAEVPTAILSGWSEARHGS